MKIELILNENEVRQLAATLNWCGEWSEFCAADPTISDKRREERKFEATVCNKTKSLLKLALKEAEKQKE